MHTQATGLSPLVAVLVLPALLRKSKVKQYKDFAVKVIALSHFLPIYQLHPSVFLSV